ncbi:YciI family protein [Salibacterium aidingense]|uniref:YciI family protein n=1 Tax=Salibacterium aidingense TaxID=384933 RepID=UPI00040D4F23|nr:YciI family protein [Salibacterium aidingense]
MRYFAVLLPLKDQDLSRTYRPDHLAFLEKQRNEGNVAANGKFTDGSGGLVIYRADKVEDVEALVKQDPFVIQGARDYEIHEWEMVSKEWK